ncbi:MAG: hypothetical protein KKA64_00955 [Nanoarchaeota archaeon]|nr:hypothetical protein [Nanoarchaeota archaeon]
MGNEGLEEVCKKVECDKVVDSRVIGGDILVMCAEEKCPYGYEKRSQINWELEFKGYQFVCPRSYKIEKK